MKINTFAIFIPAIFMVSSAHAVEGETSSVVFTGNIVEATCELSSGSRSKAVELGDVATTAFIAGAGIATTGVGIQILENGTPLKLNGSQASSAKPLDEGNNVLPFSARYISTLAITQAGEANAVANFTLNYE